MEKKIKVFLNNFERATGSSVNDSVAVLCLPRRLLGYNGEVIGAGQGQRSAKDLIDRECVV